MRWRAGSSGGDPGDVGAVRRGVGGWLTGRIVGLALLAAAATGRELRADPPPPVLAGTRRVPRASPQAISDPPQALAGRVVRGPDSAGVVGVRIELHRVTADSGALVDSTRSGPDGAFLFSFREPPGSEAVYLAAARHQGVRYFGAPLHGGAEPAGPYLIAVYDTAAVQGPAASVVLAMRHAILSPLGPPGAAVEVTEVFDLAGDSARTLVPVPPGSPVWSTGLPAGATDARVLPAGAAGGEVVVEEGRVSLSGSLPPSGRRVAIRYVVPGHELLLAVDHPTRRLELLIGPPAAGARVRGLAEAPATEVEGRSYLRFHGAGLEPGAGVTIELAGATRGAAPWLWLAVAVVLLAAAVLLRRRLPAEGPPA